MKKSYETPSIEVVKFQYRDQVVVASGNIEIICGQKWTGAGSEAVSGCSFTGVIQKDSGY